MEYIRSFIAIEIPDEMQEELVQLQSRLQIAGQPPVKWVDPLGIHLTLKFLGNIAASRVAEILGALETAAESVPPFRLEAGECGVFPNVRKTQVAWLGLRGDVEMLAQLQQRIDLAMSRLGFARETRAFRPHLTLARVRDRATAEERLRFGQAFLQAKLSLNSIIMADRIHLIKSQLTREGAFYSRLGDVELKKLP